MRHFARRVAVRSGQWLAAALVAGVLQACGGGRAGSESEAHQAVQDPATVLPLREQAANVEGAPIYRFAKISTGAYFYTGSQDEADYIRASMPDFRYEGIAFQQSAQAGGTPVYRFANLSNGGYFYTASVAERDATIVNYPNMRYEGTTFSVAGDGNPNALPVFRLANLNNGAYLFTSNTEERNYAVSLGFWRYEGSTFSAVPADGTENPGGPDPCERTQPWRVVSGLGGCATCADGGPGGESSGESVGAGGAWSQVRNMRARVIKPDGTLLGEANVSDGAVSLYPGCYRSSYIIEFVALNNAEYFDEAIESWRPIPPANARLRVAMPAHERGKDISANPFTEAAYQYAVQLKGGQANLTANDIRQANERVRSEANAKLMGRAETAAALAGRLVDRETRAAVSASLTIEDITLLPTLINATTRQGALDTSARGRWAAQLAALVKAARTYSGNTLNNPALDFTNHLVKDMLDNGRINPETRVDRQTYGVDSPGRVQVAIEDAARTWGTQELVTQVTPQNPAGCSSSAITWTQSGNACSATVSGQYAHNASLTVTDAVGSLKGTAQAVCSNGTWVATGTCSSGPLLSCASTVLDWVRGGNTCSATAASSASGGTVTLSDMTGSTTGTASATCNNGSWTVDPASGTCAAALGCAAMASVPWSQGDYQCEAPLAQAPDGSAVSLSDTLGQAVGSATATCRNGSWSLANPVCRPSQPISVSGGNDFTVAVMPDGTLWAWGKMTSSENDALVTVVDYGTRPVQIGSGYRAVSAGFGHALAVRQDGSLWAWGSNAGGQLGDGTTLDRTSPVQVGSGYQAVAAGYAHSLGVRQDGGLWSWGSNQFGQLGDGTQTHRRSPVQIGAGYRAVAAGWSHSVGLRQDGSVWAWGYNFFGQAGQGVITPVNHTSPVLVGSGYQAVSAGGDHSLGVRQDGSLWAWGYNGSGQLGDGTTTDRWSPVLVGTGYQAAEGGTHHSLGLRQDGSVWAWGYNAHGQLGDGTTTNRWSPVLVGGTYQSIAAGGYHSLGVRQDGTLQAWGGNWSGQIGNGTVYPHTSPATVLFGGGISILSQPASADATPPRLREQAARIRPVPRPLLQEVAR